MSDRHQVLCSLQLYGVEIAEEPIYELSSGEKSRYYVDVKAASLQAKAQQPLANLLAAEVNSFGPDAVAGVALGGCHLASIVAATRWATAPLDVVYVRKEPKGHGTKKHVEGKLLANARIVLVEDVITTGDSSRKAIELIREAGHEVVGVVAVVDRRTTKTDWLSGVPLKTLFALGELI